MRTMLMILCYLVIQSLSEVWTAELLSVDPGRGPLAGGTLLTVRTAGLQAAGVTISLGGVSCSDVTARNISGNYQCTTRPVPSARNVSVTVTYSDGGANKILTSPNVRFRYMTNPTVDVPRSRLQAIISGGILFTFSGYDLLSVVYPRSLITWVKGNVKKEFYSECVTPNSTKMVCLTPDLRPLTRIISRPTPSDYLSTFTDGIFYFGLVLDGVDSYQNLSDVTIHTGPKYTNFSERDIPTDTSELPVTLKGVMLNHGCTKDDVTVHINKAVCKVKELSFSELTCSIPSSAVPSGSYYPVQVHVGITDFVTRDPAVIITLGLVSRVGAGLSLWAVLLIAGVAVLVVFALVVGTILFCAKERRKKNKAARRQDDRRKQYNNEGFNPGVNNFDRPRIPDAVRENRTAYHPQQQSSMPAAAPPPQLLEAGIKTAPISAQVDSPQAPPTMSGRDNLLSPGYLSPQSDQRTNSLARHPGFPPPEYNLWEYIDDDLKFRVRDRLIDSKMLSLGRIIGQGNFGKVYIGMLSTENSNVAQKVAVKTVSGESTPNDLVDFLEEALIMKDFNHVNILPLCGVVIDYQKPYVVLPYMDYGDLRCYVRDTSVNMSVRQLVAMALQVSRGMEYLEQQKFVHRDLAARNCMVNKDLVVKIADFGLARDIYTSDYYRMSDKHRAVPVKWMAVESLETGVYTSKSDVWSYGVLMWELLTRGGNPYPDVGNYDIKDYVITGRRLTKPPHAPMEIYQLMSSCWLEDPDARPNFTDIASRISDILDKPYSSRPDSTYMSLVDS